MSFTANPFKNITIVEMPDRHWTIECTSCGACIGFLGLNNTIDTIIRYNEAHLQNSHKLSYADVAHWT